MMWVVLLLAVPVAAASADLVDPGLPAVSAADGEYPLVPVEQFKHMGRIVASLDDLGSIVGNPNRRVVVGVGETVYIDIGTEQGVAVGDRFSIVVANRLIHAPPQNADVISRWEAATWKSYLDSIKNRIPFLRKPLGVMVFNLGTLDVVKSEKNLSEAIVRESFGPIRAGARLIAYRQPVVPKWARNYKSSVKDIDGHIVAFREKNALAGMQDVVFIDKGESGNVAVGDRFEVYVVERISQKSAWYDVFPESRQISWTVGELQVVATQKETSTAVIRKARREILVGQRVRYVPMSEEGSAPAPVAGDAKKME